LMVGLSGLSEVVPVSRLLDSEAALLLSYPRFDPVVAEGRLEELGGLGVDALVLRGRHTVGELRVMGKGHVGVVVVALLGGEEVALKVRRVDADRASLDAEAGYLRLANGVSVGPIFRASSTNFLVMELVEGDYLVDWLGGLGSSEGGVLRGVLKRLLEKARRLDVAGLDHGELSRADRHVIVSGGDPRIVDFESASTVRRCANVTSLAHYLFFNRRVSGLIGGVVPLPAREELIGALGGYRRGPSEWAFLGVLDVCGLSA